MQVFMRTIFWPLSLVLLLIVPAFAADLTIIRNEAEPLTFKVEIASTPEAREKGLMFRKDLADDAGMLFVYDRPQMTKFWMKNTLIPLDMLFTDVNGTIIHIHEKAKPLDLTPVGPNTSNVCAVLEVRGGTVKSKKIAIGDKIHTSNALGCLH